MAPTRRTQATAARKGQPGTSTRRSVRFHLLADTSADDSPDLRRLYAVGGPGVPEVQPQLGSDVSLRPCVANLGQRKPRVQSAAIHTAAAPCLCGRTWSSDTRPIVAVTTK